MPVLKLDSAQLSLVNAKIDSLMNLIRNTPRDTVTVINTLPGKTTETFLKIPLPIWQSVIAPLLISVLLARLIAVWSEKIKEKRKNKNLWIYVDAIFELNESLVHNQLGYFLSLIKGCDYLDSTLKFNFFDPALDRIESIEVEKLYSCLVENRKGNKKDLTMRFAELIHSKNQLSFSVSEYNKRFPELQKIYDEKYNQVYGKVNNFKEADRKFIELEFFTEEFVDLYDIYSGIDNRQKQVSFENQVLHFFDYAKLFYGEKAQAISIYTEKNKHVRLLSHLTSLMGILKEINQFQDFLMELRIEIEDINSDIESKLKVFTDHITFFRKLPFK